MADVPVGGGVVLTDAEIVVTQPTAGTIKAFTAVCTHQGFTVGRVQDGQIICLHHGSRYDAATGAVVMGPAPRALAEIAVAVSGGQVVKQ